MIGDDHDHEDDDDDHNNDNHNDHHHNDDDHHHHEDDDADADKGDMGVTVGGGHGVSQLASWALPNCDLDHYHGDDEWQSPHYHHS